MKKIGGLLVLVLVTCLSFTGCGGGNSKSQNSTTQTSAPTLASISVTASTNSVITGSTLPLTAKGTYSDSSIATLTSQLTWATSDSTIASVSASGVVTGVKAGSVTVTAADGTISGKITITVTASQATLSFITVNAPSLSVTSGATEQLTATGTYSDSSTQNVTSQATWQSSDDTVATVNSSGLLTAAGTGTAIITASIGTVSGTTSITVTAPTSGGGTPTLSSIAIVPSSFSIASGQGKQLAANGIYSDGSSQDITTQVNWVSNATNFIAVSSSGLARGVAAGSATITASLGSTSATASGTVTATALNSIYVTPSSASVAIGATQQFAANGIFSDGSSTDLTNSVEWSSNAGFATIDQTGLATGVATGLTTISAVSSSTTGLAALSVTSAVLTSIDISPDGQSIPVGGQYQLTLTASYSDNTTQTITNATWTSSDPSLATIDPHTGIVTGVVNSNGIPVTISASFGGQTNTTTVYVTSAVPESLVLTPSTASIASGTTEQYSVNAIYSDGTIQPLSLGLTWSSSSASVAAVNANGLATGLGVGQSTITVSYDSMATTATLTVTSAALASIVVTPATPTLGINGNLQFTATGVFTDGSTQDMTAQATWSSSAASVALISNSGIATALSTGTTTIGANYQGVNGSSTLTVTTAKLVSITISPANPIVPPRARIQLTAIGVFSDGSTAQISGASWRTNTGRYATVSGNGVVRTKKSTNQPVPVYASLNGITGQTTLTVTSMSIVDVQITPANPTIAVGTTQPFKLLGTFSDGVTTVDLSASAQWQTSNYKTAVINRSGVATARTSGSDRVTGSYGSVPPATTTLTISNATIQSIAVTPSAPTIALGTTQAFDATGTFSDGSSQDITSVAQWISSAPAVAIVNQAGVATSASRGQSNVNVTFNGVSGSAELTVQ